MSEQPEEVVQTLTVGQIEEVAHRIGVPIPSVIDVIAYINKNDFIALGIVSLTPDIVVGYLLKEEQDKGLL
jgi:hypothetical protein